MSEDVKPYGNQLALRVALEGEPWPAKLCAQATALLGIRGAGKSNLARVFAEEAYRSKIPVVVFDPVGNWYGIRAGKDGKPDGGLPFAIFGGRHGDVPLEANAGQLIADTVVDTRVSCVIDMSHEDFSEGDKQRFLAAFGDRLFRRKQPETGWMLLILEEADDYAPQGARGGPALQTLGVFQRLVKRGRFKGLGALLVTQRSAAISKDVLNMADTLVAFRTTASHDQAAVEGWIKHHSLSTDALKTLPSLPAGEAWVWSPEALGRFERVRFRRMETLDTGRTPDHVEGKLARPATLADIDVPTLRERMAETIERHKATDPGELQRRVAQLERELARYRNATSSEVEKLNRRRALKDGQLKTLAAFAARAEAHLKRWEQLQEKAHQGGAAALEAAALGMAQAQEIGRALAAFQGGADAKRDTQIATPRDTAPTVSHVGAVLRDWGPEPAAPGGREDGPTRILRTIAELQERGLAVTREAVARWMGIHPGGRRYNAELAALRAAGRLQGFEPTAQAQRRHAHGPEGVLSVLSGTTHKVMLTILGKGDTRGSDGFTREQLAEQLGIHPGGRRFNSDLAWLRQMGVIPERGAIYPVPGVYR